MRIPVVIRERSTDWVLQFINIVFLLLLYFLVNGSIVDRQQQNVELPVTAASQTGAPPRGALYVDRRGAMSYGGVSVTLDEAVARLKASGGLAAVTVAADRALPAAKLISVLDALKANGASEMTIVTVASGSG